MALTLYTSRDNQRREYVNPLRTAHHTYHNPAFVAVSAASTAAMSFWVYPSYTLSGGLSFQIPIFEKSEKICIINVLCG